MTVTPEMVEKARERWIRDVVALLRINFNGHHLPHSTVGNLYDEAVQEAVREFEPYMQHTSSCANQYRRTKECVCGLSALRQKWGVK